MPRKTRKQKFKADRIKNTTAADLVFAFKPSKTATLTKSSSSPTSHLYPYLRRDLIKTVIIGGAFISGEILLALFTKRLGW